MTNKEKLTHMPQCQQWISEFRKVFGDPVRILAKEAGYVVEWKK